jgi:hypothetical protein
MYIVGAPILRYKFTNFRTNNKNFRYGDDLGFDPRK